MINFDLTNDIHVSRNNINIEYYTIQMNDARDSFSDIRYPFIISKNALLLS